MKDCPYCDFRGRSHCGVPEVAERILANGGTPGDSCSNKAVYGPRKDGSVVDDATHARLTAGPCAWTSQRVSSAGFNAARAVFGTSTEDDDKLVYRALQAYLNASSV